MNHLSRRQRPTGPQTFGCKPAMDTPRNFKKHV